MLVLAFISLILMAFQVFSIIFMGSKEHPRAATIMALLYMIPIVYIILAMRSIQ